MNIMIIVPFKNADRMVPVWAIEEDKIDFRQEVERAARCTCSYAALELEKYISRTLKDVSLCFGEKNKKNSFNIELNIEDYSSRCDEFILEPCERGLVITGKGRTGILYGAYELLRLQGWRWYAPGDEGEIQPEKSEKLVLPDSIVEYKPSMNYGRGFDFGQWYSKDSIKFWIWMSKNRMNVAAYRPYTAALCNKLGMQFKNGGHIFEKCLDPDRIMPSGKTLWDEHIKWFGQCSDGSRKKELARKIQFCVSNDDLIKYLADYFLEYLSGIWKYADRVDIWGFDTWGQTCNCDICRALGNSTDQNLYFISRIRSHLNRARKDGRLDHDVKMVFCGYEGTCTIEGPENPVPQNILKAGDLMVYYPIRRCFAHDFSDESCEINTFYRKALESWLKKDPAVPVVIGEYYNVSKFEDLPIIFSQRIAKDIPFYHKMGVGGATYMHVPMSNWGMRTLTQVMFAQMSWDINTDVDKLLSEYFDNWYGPYAGDMRLVYCLVEEAWLFCADWRAWGSRSILTQLLNWDGGRPGSRLEIDNHFKTAGAALESGRNSIRLLARAVGVLNDIRERDKLDCAINMEIKAGAGVNPEDELKCKTFNRYSKRIGEDRRLLIYAFDTMKLMTEVVAYHHALWQGDDITADNIWIKIKNIEESMDSYYMPILYDYPSPGIECLDALTRTQLQDVISRCRRARLMKE